MNAPAQPQIVIRTILEEEQRVCTRLLTVAEAERQALLISDVDTLAPLVREMEALADAMMRLEDDRIHQTALLTGRREDADATFHELTEFVGDAEGIELEALRRSLRNSLERLHTVNITNAALARQALTLTDQWSRLLKGAVSGTYGADGAPQGSTPARQAWSA